MKSLLLFLLLATLAGAGVNDLTGWGQTQAGGGIKPVTVTGVSAGEVIIMDSLGVPTARRLGNLDLPVPTLNSYILLDSFTDATGTAAQLHMGEAGAAWRLCQGTGAGGTAVIYSTGIVGRLRGNSAGIGIYGSSAIVASANYSVSASVAFLTNVDQFVGVGARLDHLGQAGYFFGARPASSQWQLLRMVGNFDTPPVITTLGTAPQTFAAGNYNITLECYSSRIRCYVGGTQVIEVTDTGIVERGRPGIMIENASADTTGTQLDSMSADDGFIAPVVTNNVALVVEGDSLSSDLFREGTDTVGTGLCRVLGTRAVWNYAYPGRTLATMNALSAQVDQHFSSLALQRYQRRVTSLLGGFNDIAGSTAAQVITSLTTWHTARRATGWESVAVTLPTSQYFITGVDATKWAQINDAIRTGQVGATWTCDLSADARLSNSSNATYFLPDKIHLTEAGERIYSELLAATVQRGVVVANVQIMANTTTYAATTKLDFGGNSLTTLPLTGNVTFTSSNLAAGRALTVRVVCDATLRTLTFPGTWTFLGAAAPVNIAAGKTGVLALTAFGTTDSTVVAAWSAQP